ncbi:MAG: RdgB/HAM1 family non-canonical purine NTP pyrophosphatase [Chitinivibrionales bacterium]|nr:RdgB/HAM1 family non-canonical purine NTP pyrophosphatase [Chitinivibrionales bacterium]
MIIASGNAGKRDEIEKICGDLDFSFKTLRDYWDPVPQIEETGETFLENAFIKAQWVFDRLGLPTLADDSGLQVDCLGGEPGVRSARYAGENATDEQNNRKLLKKCAECSGQRRSARFRCVIVCIFSPEKSIAVEGMCEGKIGYSPKGNGGFGYDPLFIPDGYDMSFAQLDSATKNTVSHRGKALKKLKEKLRNISV